MYKLIKEKGFNANVSILNTETEATINLGRVSIPLLTELEKEGHTLYDPTSTDEDRRDASKNLIPNERWELDIKDETAKTLMATAMPIKAPSRKEMKEKEKEKKKQLNKKIDAMDVILGLATYN